MCPLLHCLARPNDSWAPARPSRAPPSDAKLRAVGLTESKTPDLVRVALYHATDCHLCERARAVLEELRAQEAFELEEVDITGDPELESRYREWLPVVEIDDVRVFTYYVHPEAFRQRLAQARGRAGTL